MAAETHPGQAEAHLPRENCPYKGLAPYTEADQAYFFGRENDRDVIIANLYAARITVLYGASGVGKSSVLLAGVLPSLRTTPRLAVVAFREWQAHDFLTALKRQIVDTVNAASKRPADVDVDLPLDDLLVECQEIVHGPIFLIFDQFEEFFLYHPPSLGLDGFEAELAGVVNRLDVDAHVLLSLREDGLSKLDRFDGRIANVLGNMLRIDHLDRDDATSAILSPLRLYTREHVPVDEAPYRAEEGLVQRLLLDVQRSNVSRADPTPAQIASPTLEPVVDDRIETALLQMVLIKLWDEDVGAGSRTLHLATLERLGGVGKIAHAHLDERLKLLTDAQLAVAMSILPFLVTETGSKIALEPSTLAAWAKRPEPDVSAVLERLAQHDMRIVRPVEPPGLPKRFEIFHDVMGSAILERCREFEKSQAVEESIREAEERYAEEQAELAQRARERALIERERRNRFIALGLACLILVLGWLTYFAFDQRNDAQLLATLAEMRHQEAVDSAVVAEVARHEADEQRAAAVNAVSTSQVAASIAQTAVVEAETRRIVQEEALATAVAALTAVQAAQTELDQTINGVVAAANQDVALATAPSSTPPPPSIPGPAGTPMPGSTATPGLTPTVEVTSAAPATRASTPTPAPTVGPLIPNTVWYTLAEPFGAVYSAAFNGEGDRVLTAHERGVALIWQAASERPELTFSGHTGRVYTAWFSQDGSRVVTAGEDRTARIWDAHNAVEILTLTGHSDRVVSAVFSPDGSLVATASADFTARIWDAGSGQTLLVLQAHQALVTGVAFNDDGSLLATSSDDRTVRFWDPRSGERRGEPLRHAREVTGVTFSRDGQRVGTSGADAIARVWNLGTRQVERDLAGHRGRVLSVAFSPDDSLLATTSDDGTARLWDTAGRETYETARVLLSHTDRVYTAMFSQDGSRVVTASRAGVARVWGPGARP